MIGVSDSFFFQAEDGIRDLVRSRGLGDVYKRQTLLKTFTRITSISKYFFYQTRSKRWNTQYASNYACLLYTSDAADERSSVDLGGRRIIKKKNKY